MMDIAEESDNDEPPSTYSGGTDITGRAHGRGTQYYESGDTFCGHFKHGVRQGRGTLYFADDSTLSGTYHNDNLEGPGEYVFADGSRMEAMFEGGVMSGSAREYDPDGFLTFQGHYKHNRKSGVCWFYRQDGGCVVGQMDRSGALSGHHIAYLYPDRCTAIVGKFLDGQLVSGQWAKVVSVRKGVPSFKKWGPRIGYDISTREKIATDLLLEDPYEQERVYVSQSLIPDAGEGLFSKVSVSANTVMAFYNGIRLSHQEVDSRGWEENGNTISLNEDVVIDVPAPYISTLSYRATLGHKANHSFTPNCMYDHFEHPCFGPVKCIRTIRPVAAQEELTVAYGYHHQPSEGDTAAPAWYITQEARFLGHGRQTGDDGIATTLTQNSMLAA